MPGEFQVNISYIDIIKNVKQNKKYIYVNIRPNSEKYAIYLDGMRKS